MAVVTLISGCLSFQAMGEAAQSFPQELLERPGCRKSPRTEAFQASSEPTLRRNFQSVCPVEFGRAVGEWFLTHDLSKDSPLSVDGKTLKGSRTTSRKPIPLLSAFLASCDVTLAQIAVPDKTNEIPEIKTLLGPLDISGRTVVADALHTRTETARWLVEEKKAHDILPVKDNQPSLQDDIACLDVEALPPLRPPKRSIRATAASKSAPSTPPECLNDYLAFPHVAQVFRITRTVTRLSPRHTTVETVYGVPSFSASLASPLDLLNASRKHWKIESHHWVRDVTCLEDRCTIRTRSAPQNMTTLRNLVIGLIRLSEAAQKSFRDIPVVMLQCAPDPKVAFAFLGI